MLRHLTRASLLPKAKIADLECVLRDGVLDRPKSLLLRPVWEPMRHPQGSRQTLLCRVLLLSEKFSEHIFSAPMTPVAILYMRLLSFYRAPLTRTCSAVRKEVVMKRTSLLVALICCVFTARISAAA